MPRKVFCDMMECAYNSNTISKVAVTYGGFTVGKCWRKGLLLTVEWRSGCSGWTEVEKNQNQENGKVERW